MKIAIISGLYPPYSRGGAEWVAEEEARFLVREGNDVVVITTRPKEEPGETPKNGEFQDGVRVYRVSPWNLFDYYNMARHNFLVRSLWHLIDMVNVFGVYKIKNILEQEKPDMVITHNLKGFGFLVPLFLKKKNFHHVHVLHDIHLAVPSGRLQVGARDGLTHRAYRVVVRSLFGSPKEVRSPSKWLMEFYEKRGFFEQSKKTVVLTPRIQAFASAKSTPRHERHTTNVLFVGQIEEHKGIHDLLEVWKELAPQAHLHVVGTGTLLDKLRILLEGDKTITVHGFVKRDQLAKLYGSADLVIIPSLIYENAPTVIFEAHAFNVPLIAADAGGIKEFLHPRDILVPSGDKKALKNALEKALL